MFYFMSCVCTPNLHSTGGSVEWEQAAYPTRRPVSGVLVLMYSVELRYSCLHITWKYKVGYKRVDVYGTLLGPTPHRN